MVRIPLGVRDFLLVIRAKDQASRVIADVGRSFGSLDKTVQTHAKNMRQSGQALLGVGAGVGAVGAAGIAFLGSSVNAAIKYNKESAKTLTQTGELGAKLEDIKRIGRDVALATSAPIDQMQASLYDIFSSMNVTVPQAELLLRNFSKGAVAGVTDVETASQAAISLLNAFKLPPTATNIKRVMDAQFETVRVGRIEYEELARTIGRAIPSAVKAGQSMEDLGGMIAFLTRNGLSAAMSATSAARALDLLTNPKFGAKLKGIGVDVADAEGNFRPMLDVMTDLRKRFEGVTDPAQAKRMQDFLGSFVDPKGLKFLEDMGIQVKQTIGGKDFSAQVKKNASTSAAIATQNAQLRVKLSQTTSKEEKKAINDQIKQNNLQRAILSEQNVNLRAAGTKAQEVMRPVAAIMADLNKKLQEVSPEERAALMSELTKGAGGAIQAMRFVNLAITDTDEQFKALTLDVRDSQGAMEKAYGIMRNTPAQKIEDMKNRWKIFRQELGDNLIPVVDKLLDWGIKVLKWWQDLSPETKRNTAYIAAAASAFFLLAGALTAAAGAFLIFNSAFAAFGLKLAPILLLFGQWLVVIGLVGLAAYILLKNWGDFKLGLRVIVAMIVDLFLGMAESVLEIAASMFGWVPGLGGKLRRARDDFREFRDGINQDILGIKQPVIEPVIKKVVVDPAVYEQFKQMPAIFGAKISENLINKATLVDTSMTNKGPVSTKDRMQVQYRARGGPVRAFREYIVGERGPELLRMGNRSGQIISRIGSAGKKFDSMNAMTIYGDTRNRLPYGAGMRFRKDARLDTSQIEDRRNYPHTPPASIQINARTNASARDIADEMAWTLRYET